MKGTHLVEFQPFIANKSIIISVCEVIIVPHISDYVSDQNDILFCYYF